MDWKNFSNQVSNGLKDLSIGSLSRMKDTLEKEVLIFLEKSKSRYEEWSQQALEGTLTREECERLVRTQMASAEIIALKQGELTKGEIQKFFSGLVKLIVDTIFRLLL